MICSYCGKEIIGRIYSGQRCQGCYVYMLKGGVIHSLPSKGEIKYDNKGYVICHICGKSYIRLGSHIKESHNMTIQQYKEEFGLCNCTKTTEKKYSSKMKDLALKNGMDKALIQTGKNTRISKENILRKGKKSRLQECIERSNRYKK